jgi:hypothetical protein
VTPGLHRGNDFISAWPWLVSQPHFIIANHLPEIVAAVAFMTGSLRGAIALAVFRICAEGQ